MPELQSLRILTPWYLGILVNNIGARERRGVLRSQNSGIKTLWRRILRKRTDSQIFMKLWSRDMILYHHASKFKSSIKQGQGGARGGISNAPQPQRTLPLSIFKLVWETTLDMVSGTFIYEDKMRNLKPCQHVGLQELMQEVGRKRLDCRACVNRVGWTCTSRAVCQWVAPAQLEQQGLASASVIAAISSPQWLNIIVSLVWRAFNALIVWFHNCYR